MVCLQFRYINILTMQPTYVHAPYINSWSVYRYNTSTRQKIRIFWKIAITFLTLAQNPFNYSKRFNIILEINESKLVHNYGNFNYKYMYFFKNCIFLRIFLRIFI